MTRSFRRSPCRAESASKCTVLSQSLLEELIKCSFCRIGFTARCAHSALFGTPGLPGGQAQFVRVPKAGGTLLKIDDITSLLHGQTQLADTSLILLADILPTGAFAALQVLQHPKLSALIHNTTYPYNGFVPKHVSLDTVQLTSEDRTITFAVIGLGPVGIVSLQNPNEPGARN